jgi:hypothetical protein
MEWLSFFGYIWSGMFLLHGCTFWFGLVVIDARFITSSSPVECLLFLSLILTKLFQSKSILVIFCSGFSSLGNNVVQIFGNSKWSCIVLLPNLCECPVAFLFLYIYVAFFLIFWLYFEHHTRVIYAHWVPLWYLLILFFVYIFIFDSVARTSLQSDLFLFFYCYLGYHKCRIKFKCFGIQLCLFCFWYIFKIK